MVIAYRMLLGIGMLVLSGNTFAIMILSGGNAENTGNTEYSKLSHDLLVQVGAGDFSETRRELKLSNKVNKLLRKIDRYELREESGGLNAGQANKLTRLQDRLLLILALMDIPDMTALVADETGPGMTRTGGAANWTGRAVKRRGVGKTGGFAGNDHDLSVPEPSTIALLGIGFFGIGTRHCLRKGN